MIHYRLDQSIVDYRMVLNAYLHFVEPKTISWQGKEARFHTRYQILQ
jgi:hypothetical protein